MDSVHSKSTELDPTIELLKSIWEDKNGNWLNLDKDCEGKLTEIIATKDFRLYTIDILDAFACNKNSSSVAAALQIIIYAILRDLKVGDREGDELENWLHVPHYTTIVDYVFTLVPTIKSHLLTSYGPNVLPDKRSILYECIVATLAAFILRSKEIHFPKLERTILKYIVSPDTSQSILAMDIWILLVRGNRKIAKAHIFYLANKLASAKDDVTRLVQCIRRGYFVLTEEEKDEFKQILAPLKKKLPWILDELSPETREDELKKILSNCKAGSKVDILDIRCACYLLANNDKFVRESEEVKKIVPYVFHLKKNLLQKKCSQKILRKLVNECFLLMSKFLSIRSFDDFLSCYLDQQAKDDFNVITEGSLLDEVDEQVFIANVFYSNVHRIAKSQFGAETLIQKSLQLRCSSPIAESIWMDFWAEFCRCVPWPNLIRKFFSFESRSTPLPFDKRRAFHEYLKEVPVLDKKEMFSRLDEFFMFDLVPSLSETTSETTRESDVRTFAGQVEYEPPVKKKKVICFGSNGKFTAEPLDDLVNQNLIRLKESLTFFFNASHLPDKVKPAVFQAKEMVESVVAKHWPENDAPSSLPKDSDVVDLD